MQGRDVAIVDILNAFVQTDLIKYDKPMNIIGTIKGNSAELLCEITPDIYIKYAVRDR